jgi:hypothetical protein
MVMVLKVRDFPCAFPKDVTCDMRDSDVVTKTECIVLLCGDVRHTSGRIENSSQGHRDSLVSQNKRHD